MLKLQPEDLKQAISQIKMWQRAGERAPHKPLLLLYALGRLKTGKSMVAYVMTKTE
jgi:putative restriction endonuclease